MLLCHRFFFRPRVLPWHVCFLCLEPSSPGDCMASLLHFFQVNFMREACPDFCCLPFPFFRVLRRYTYRITNILRMFACDLLTLSSAIRVYVLWGWGPHCCIPTSARTCACMYVLEYIAHTQAFIRQKRKVRVGKWVWGRERVGYGFYMVLHTRQGNKTLIH